MSQVNDTNEIKSFWEIGQFKQTITFFESGFQCCEDLYSFVHDRAMVEANYHRQLKNWEMKYTKVINRYSFSSTSVAAWKSFLDEADEVAQVHLNVSKRLLSDICTKIKEWKKAQYHHHILFGLKESRSLKKEFKQGQKQWVQSIQTLNKAKKLYFNRCHEALATKSRIDGAVSAGLPNETKIMNLKKSFELKNSRKYQAEVEYKNVLKSNGKVKDTYVTEMQDAFVKCEKFEESRLAFFIDSLQSLFKWLSLSKNKNNSVHVKVEEAVSRASVKEDIQCMRKNCGLNIPMNWPQFEKFNPKSMSHITPVNMTKPSYSPSTVYGSRKSSLTPHDPRKTVNLQNNAKLSSVGILDDTKANNKSMDNLLVKSSLDTSCKEMLLRNQSNAVKPRNSSLFTASNYESDDGESGVRVRALFSYDGHDEDELSFTEGDILYLLTSEDKMGWCKGRLENGTVGLFPANYVEKFFKMFS